MSFLDFNKDEKLELSDEDIIEHSVSKPELFEVLIDRYQQAFLRKAKSILRSKEESEDTVQEAFTKIYLNASKFERQEGASFKSWAYKILINTSLTNYQKLKRKGENTMELTEVMSKVIEDPETAESMNKKELSDYVARAMTVLPKALSRVLHLHFVERRPQKEIAKLENISLGAVKTRIYRAKKEFRKIGSEQSERPYFSYPVVKPKAYGTGVGEN